MHRLPNSVRLCRSTTVKKNVHALLALALATLLAACGADDSIVVGGAIDASPGADATELDGNVVDTFGGDTAAADTLADAAPPLDAVPGDTADAYGTQDADTSADTQAACPESSACDDGNPCTAGDSCKGGVCTGGAPLACDDGNPCSDDTCDPKAGCVNLANAASCSDGNACTGPDVCKQGKCSGGQVTCDDSNPCTDDVCDPVKGCSAVPNAAPCVDANACDLGDTCEAGACKGGKAKDCSDGNPCTLDSCDPASGTCSHPAAEAACDDGSQCTSSDACKDGQCVGTQVVCDDGNPCSTDSCDKAAGCVAVLNQAPCDDGNACSDFDKCDQGKCKGIAKDAADCDDGNACTTDSCDKKLGCVALNNTAVCDDGNSCTVGDTCEGGKCASGVNTCDCQKDSDCAAKEDGNACNGTLFCDKSKGTCVVNPKTIITCPTAGNSACAQQKCDTTTGQCALGPISEGNPCDADGTVCTAGDKCVAGTCGAGSQVMCDDNNPCTTDTCDPIAGCKNVANNAPCDADGNACTAGDGCADKVCNSGKLKICDDNNPCTADSCDKSSGACVFDGSAKEGDPCDADGSNCTPGDACKLGACQKGAALNCDDSSVCTIDSCNPNSGCLHLAATAACDADGDACTVGDVCDSKLCVAGPKKNCDDGDLCTADACDATSAACSHAALVGCGGNCATDGDCDDKNLCTTDSCSKGKCAYVAAAGTCDDGNVCTKGDACTGGKCSGAALNCDDGKVCTSDSCDTATGCKNVDNLGPCDDGDGCTSGDQCKAGSCGAGLPKVCDDGDACTKDTCNPADGSCKFTGIAGCGIYCAKSLDCDDKNVCTDESCQGGKCVWVNNTLGCDDANPCSVGDVCASSKCVSGAAKNCSDNNACTADSCDTSSGNCVNTSLAATATCDDGNACTNGDNCSGINALGKAACSGIAKSCNDGNACTTDTCVAASGGCTYANNALPCDDGNPCTPADTCASGKCVAGSQLTIDTMAGSGSATYADGTGANASFYYPYGIAADASGNAYVADTYNNRIRKVTPAGIVTTLAGNAAPGYTDAKGTSALFNLPFGIALDKAGNLVVADYNNNVIRKIATDGTVTTLAGTGAAGWGDGPAGLAKFNHPTGVAVGPGGLIAVADYANHRIRIIDSKGNVTTLAGSGSATFADAKIGSQASFYYPLDLRFDNSGTLFVGDQYNHRIRMVTATGEVSTVAGTGVAGIQDGDAASARFYYPWGIAIGPDGAVYVGDRYNHRIRKILGGKVSTWAGTGVAGWLDGQANLGRLNYPAAIAFDPAGYLYIGDGNNHRIRRVRDGSAWCFVGSQCATAGWVNPNNSCQICDPSTSQSKWTTLVDSSACDDGDLCTQSDACVQGKCGGSTTSCNDGDSCTLDVCNGGTSLCTFTPIVGCGGNCGGASDCDDSNPCTTDSCISGKCQNANNNLACDDGNSCTLGDQCVGGSCTAGNQVVVSTLAGSGTYGYKDGAGNQAQFKRPFGLDFDGDGNFYVAEYDGHVIRKVAPDSTVSLFAGSGTGGLADGKGAAASFYYPTDVAVGPGNKVYVADRYNHRVRVIDPDGTVATLAGSVSGYLDGPAVSARFQEPIGIAVNAAGVVLVVEYAGHRIRRIQGGVVTTLAGSIAGFADGPGSKAQLNGPISIAFDSAGNGIFVEFAGNRIRKVTPGGVVSTLAGTGVGGYMDGAANTAMFLNPWGIAVDGAGTIYVADRSNHRIRTLSASGVVSKFAGTGTPGFKDGSTSAAQLNAPTGIAVDAQGQVWVGGDQDERIRKVVDSTKPCGVGGLCYAAGMPNPANDCEVCDPSKSPTTFSIAANGSACSDGKACTAPDACGSGACIAAAVTCDDNNACTTDACDTQTGACLNKPIMGCNGYCGKDADCDDSNPCTTDTCPASKCQFANNTLPCDDGDACTTGDICSSGGCLPGIQVWVDTPAGSGVAGYKDTTGMGAQFNVPLGVDALDDGTAYVADTNNHRIRKIAADGSVTTLAGSGNAGFLDANGALAWFSSPADVGHDAAGNVYVVDRDNHAVRKITADGTVSTVAGSGAPGIVDDKGAKAKFNTPYSLAVAPSGVVYVADYGNHRIRKVAVDGTVTTLAGSSLGYADGSGAAAKFNQPIGIGMDRAGTLYVAEYSGHRLRKVTADGVVTTIAGTGVAGSKDGDPSVASFYYPWGIAVDNAGVIYVADRYNNRIRRVEPGLVSTWAGTGGAGYKDGNAMAALFNYPVNLAITAQGSVWVADGNNSRIRRVRATALSCTIGSVCWSNGSDNPAQTCQVCNGAASQSKWSAKADTSPCADGNLCTASDTCGSGQCKGATACDDGNACTADSCEAASGACSHTIISNCP